MSDITLRPYAPADLEAIKRLTAEAFEGVTLEQNVEAALGTLNGRDWRWRKARHLDEDAAADPAGIFVAEAGGRVVGHITTRSDREAGRGGSRTSPSPRSSGSRGSAAGSSNTRWSTFAPKALAYAVIETMAQNAAGKRACGRGPALTRQDFVG